MQIVIQGLLDNPVLVNKFANVYEICFRNKNRVRKELSDELEELPDLKNATDIRHSREPA